MRLQARVTRLESSTKRRVNLRVLGLCNCRFGTHYHSAEELALIMAIRCPTHGDKRELGGLVWTPSWLPLDEAHMHLCTCPPDLMRDFRAGLRDLPTEEELQREQREREAENKGESSIPSQEEFEAERQKREEVFAAYDAKMDC